MTWLGLSLPFINAMPYLQRNRIRMAAYWLALFVLGIFLEDVIAMPLTQRDAFRSPQSIRRPFTYVQIGSIYLLVLYPVAS